MHSCATLINYYFETLFSKTFSISCLHILRTVRNTSGPSILLQRRPSHSEEESTHNEPGNAYLNIFASRNNDCIFQKLPPSFSTHCHNWMDFNGFRDLDFCHMLEELRILVTGCSMLRYMKWII